MGLRSVGRQLRFYDHPSFPALLKRVGLPLGPFVGTGQSVGNWPRDDSEAA